MKNMAFLVKTSNLCLIDGRLSPGPSKECPNKIKSGVADRPHLLEPFHAA
jgi:uncharacterized protein (DUF1499 family)